MSENIFQKQKPGTLSRLSDPLSHTAGSVILLTEGKSEGGAEEGNEGWKV